MSVTIKDVALEAGVSTATVSRVLSGKDTVSMRMRDRVLSSVEGLGYRPNALARSLREETSKTLGLVVSNVMNPFFTAVARAVEDAASEKGYSVILCNADESPDKEASYLDVLFQKRVDGLIISPARTSSPQLQSFVSSGVPVVFVDRTIEDLGIPTVRVDGRKAIEELVEHLLKLGHERLAVISGPPETVPGGDRLKAFLACAAERGAEIPEEYVRFGDFRRESGRQAMRELLRLRCPPTAVFAANNLMCLGALQAVKETDVRVPEDVSIASFDDIVWFELTQPPVTAIAQPVRELGNATAEMLLGMIEKAREPESLIIEAELIVRDSCGPPPASQ
ncbi:MAG: Ribose operon repressor [uncultured Rubrobacteraceae bacterium]|uniref:Ribose operon repressor n=1 Tax=uncultured Rubrobacteraceae bacterium TaxID=349277 RepID=A0A6J4QM24_9ACTN|nr:MAG: Ribose operon repressor [uncultured Rubrobacteraceae bacterium]